MRLSGVPVTVVGLGMSGSAAARFLAGRGARVRATDSSSGPAVLAAAEKLRELGIPAETGVHTEGFVRGSAFVVTSPGVPKQSFPLELARRLHLPVISEIELASRFCPGRITGITGSNGKTTTSHLVHRFLREAGRKAVLCGNVGHSFLDTLPSIDGRTEVVLELSSFQLEDSPTFRPAVALLLNLSPNHLDRHGTMAAYTRAKSRIFAGQRGRDAAVLNWDDAAVRRLGRRAPARCFFFSKGPLPRARDGVFARDGMAVWRSGSRERILFDPRSSPLEGAHNLENLLAASAAASLLGVPGEAMQRAADAFKTLEHRIEPLGSVDGVRFVNDSKSTTVDSTRAAVETVPAPIVLIAGGRDKGMPFASIEGLLLRKAKAAVLYGEARGTIASAWKRFRNVTLVPDLERAVRRAFAAAAPGETVLLSPMCTSFDQFDTYKHRGRTFKDLVSALRGSRGGAGPRRAAAAARKGPAWKP